MQTILTPERTLYSVRAHSKKKTFELIADTIANSVPSLRANHIFDALVARERLGNTNIGNGVAIPHAQIEQSEQIIGCFVLLKDPIDYGDDHQSVDMLIALILPPSEGLHLDLISSIAELFQHENFCENLRQATSALDLYEKLIHAPSNMSGVK
ncbi:MAG: PTS sugar transporter subunit IIA [Candidatus Berkiellales bacterium]